MESYTYQRADVEKLLKEADILELSTEARVRLECLLHYVTHGRNASVTSRRFGISRATFYHWLKRADLQDPSSLENQSKAPKSVPQPETDERTVSLIRAYRSEEVLLSKEKISERLHAEHDIALSASTVGRIISRNGFYFADTPFHRAKRQSAESKRHSDTVAATRLGIAEQARGILQTENEEHRKGGWQKAAAIAITVTGASLLVDTEQAHALEGSTFELHPAFPNQIGGVPIEGSSFTLREGGLTDTAQPLQGSTFKITAPAVSSSSTSSSSSSSETPASDHTTGGGRRTIPGVQLPSYPSAPTSASSLPSASSPLEFGKSISEIPVPTFAKAAEPGTPARTAERKTGTILPPSTRTDQTRSTHEAPPQMPPLPSPSPTETWPGGVLAMTVLLTVLAGVIGRSWLPALLRGLKKRLFAWRLKRRRSIRAIAYLARKTLLVSLLGLALLCALLWNIASASAATTVPLTQWYQGHLLNSAGSAVTTAVTIRFSEWKSADFIASDLTATGAINMSAANYVNWQEEHTLTPSSDGSFAVELGSINALPDLSTLPPATLLNLTLQVDVKASGAADSTYDLLDADTSSAAIDRTSVLSLPFARNADLLDQRDVGTGSGAIPVLSSGASLSLNGNLTVNADAEARDAVLTFGNNILNETLKFSAANSRFEFSHGLLVGGDLTATGALSVKGSMSGSSLRVDKNADIWGTLAVSGTTILDGSVGIGTTSPSEKLTVAGTAAGTANEGSIAMQKFSTTDNARLFWKDGGTYLWSLGVRAGRNDLSFFDEASDEKMTIQKTTGNVGIGSTSPETKLEVTGTMSGANLFAQGSLAASGSLSVQGPATFGSTIRIGNVTYTFPASDATASGRVLMSNGSGQLTWGSVGSGNLALRTRQIAVPMNDVTIEADGSANSANVFTGNDAGTNHHQYYTVKTGSGQLQDLTLKIKVRLPSDFVDFGAANDLRFSYKTTGAGSADSTVDILVEDQDGDDAFAAAEGQGLFNTSWTEFTNEFDQGTFDPSADQYIFITVKGYATANNPPYIGEIVLTYRSR